MPRLNMFRKLVDKIVSTAKIVEEVKIELPADTLQESIADVVEPVCEKITEEIHILATEVGEIAIEAKAEIVAIEDSIDAVQMAIEEVVKPKKNKK